MDGRVQKLAIKLGDRGLAAILVDAGLDTPQKIRRATDKELEAVPGIGSVTKGKLRAQLPRAKK